MVKSWSSKPSLWVRILLPLKLQLVLSFRLFWHKIVSHNQNILGLFLLMFNWILVILQILKLEKKESDINVVKENWSRIYLHKGLVFSILDYMYLYMYSVCFNFFSNKEYIYYMDFKTKQLNNNGFYLFNSNINIFSIQQLSLYGLRSIWTHLRLWVLPLLICFGFIYYSFFLKSLPFSKIFAGYILLGNMFYLLFSGFVFFIKKYQYRLYTSVIQRFWRRTLIIFWAIEGSLFTCFVYLIFNASQEPLHVYDNIQIYKTHFYSWRFFFN